MYQLSPVEYLGIEAVRAGVPRWHAAMLEGQRRAPKCDYTLRDGHRCRNCSIREARKLKPPVFRCRLHMPANAWPRIDYIRRWRGQRLARSENHHLRANGLAMLRQIEIRQLLHRWEIDPEFEANMIALSSGDQKRVDNWLAERGFDLDHLPEMGRPMTPCRRGFVHLRVALHLSGRLTDFQAMRSVRSAIRRDAKWFTEKAAIEATLPAWDSGPDSAEWQPSP